MSSIQRNGYAAALVYPHSGICCYLGSCTSAVLGCWLALELRGHRLAGMLFALLTVASLLLVIVWSEAETMRSVPFFLGVFAFNLFVAPVLARGNALLSIETQADRCVHERSLGFGRSLVTGTSRPL